jgi:hypothetical protein
MCTEILLQNRKETSLSEVLMDEVFSSSGTEIFKVTIDENLYWVKGNAGTYPMFLQCKIELYEGKTFDELGYCYLNEEDNIVVVSDQEKESISKYLTDIDVFKEKSGD